MIQSMTGYGRGEMSGENYKIEIEMKSVNHRYLDVNVRLPRKLAFLETVIRSQVKEFAARGKIDIFVSMEDFSENGVNIKYNRELARSYFAGIQEISEDFSLENPVSAYQLSRFPDVFTAEDMEIDETELTELVSGALKNAAHSFVSARLTEGEKLKLDLDGKLDYINSLIDQIARRSPQILQEYRQKIRENVQELLGDSRVDDTIIATEIVVFADKICVDEEMVRLRTHTSHMRETLASGGPVGRKLDFLTQEMNREANTILSKANDIEVSNHGIELKTEIEKIREQIQNIE